MLKRIPVIVINGFLGSGKTTFLRYLIKETKNKFGFIINEFGDVGIDGDLLETCNNCNDKSAKSIIELNNGCICCTVQDDFIPSIQALLNPNLNIHSIFIETSGLALPIPLLKALNWPEIRNSIYLDLVIGIINGESMINGSPINDLSSYNNQFNDTKIIDHFTPVEELFNDQLEVSDVVLISRSDLINENQFEAIKKDIKTKVRPNIPILKSFNGQTNLGFLIDTDIKNKNYIKLCDEDHDHTHAQIFSDFIKLDYFLEKSQFEHEMNIILKDINILRIKGRVWIPSKRLPLQVQIVGKKINTWYENAPKECWAPKNGGLELIVIGFDKKHISLLKNKIKGKFNILNDPKFEK